MMEYRKIQYVKKEVSRIFFGTAMPPFMQGGHDDELLDAVVEMGINAIDTARVYGGAEEVLGKWMIKRGNREKLVILSKCGHHDISTMRKRINEREIREDFETSSRLLQTDYIDIYLLHRDDEELEVGRILEWMNALHEEGKIGAFGGSNWTHQRLEAVNEYAYKHDMVPFTVSSPNFGLAYQAVDPYGGNCVSIGGNEGAEARAWYEQTQMPVVAYSSLGHGFFSGKLKSDDLANANKILDGVGMKGFAYPENFERLRRCEILAKEKNLAVPQIAMAYLFSSEMNTFGVVSTGKISKMKENVEALSCKLTETECKWLNLED